MAGGPIPTKKRKGPPMLLRSIIFSFFLALYMPLHAQGEHYVKSNAVGVAMLMLNASWEYQISDRLSVNVPLYFSGWDYFSHNHKYRCLITQPEVRYWFQQPMGLFVGAHIGVGLFNFATPSSQHRYQDDGGHTPFFNLGASVGYRHPLMKSEKWLIEYSIGLGYVHAQYDRFRNEANGKLVDTRIKNMVCIDQLSVSIVYRIDQHFKKGDRK